MPLQAQAQCVGAGATGVLVFGPGKAAHAGGGGGQVFLCAQGPAAAAGLGFVKVAQAVEGGLFLCLALRAVRGLPVQVGDVAARAVQRVLHRYAGVPVPLQGMRQGRHEGKAFARVGAAGGAGLGGGLQFQPLAKAVVQLHLACGACVAALLQGQDKVALWQGEHRRGAGKCP